MAAKLTRLFLLLLLFSGNALAGDLKPDIKTYSDLSDYELSKLGKGKVVMDSADSGEYTRDVIAFALVKAPARLIFDLVTDFPKLHEFMPNVEKAYALETFENGATVNYELGLPFGVEKRYRLKLSYDFGAAPGDDIKKTWALIPWSGLSADETIKNTSGYWLFHTTENDNETLVTYYTRTDPGDVPFGLGWIVDFMTNKAVVSLLKNTQERAEKKWQERER